MGGLGHRDREAGRKAVGQMRKCPKPSYGLQCASHTFGATHQHTLGTSVKRSRICCGLDTAQGHFIPSQCAVVAKVICLHLWSWPALLAHSEGTATQTQQLVPKQGRGCKHASDPTPSLLPSKPRPNHPAPDCVCGCSPTRG